MLKFIKHILVINLLSFLMTMNLYAEPYKPQITTNKTIVLLFLDTKTKVFLLSIPYEKINIENINNIWIDNESKFSYIYLPKDTVVKIDNNILETKDNKFYLNNKEIFYKEFTIDRKNISFNSIPTE